MPKVISKPYTAKQVQEANAEFTAQTAELLTVQTGLRATYTAVIIDTPIKAISKDGNEYQTCTVQDGDGKYQKALLAKALWNSKPGILVNVEASDSGYRNPNHVAISLVKA